MITSKVTKEPSETNLRNHTDYPVLAVEQGSKCIVLFSAKGDGVVVSAKRGASYSVGYRSTSWAMNYFSKYDGEVTISNS